MHCMAFCPEKAIEASHSWAVVLFKLLTISISAWLAHRYGPRLPIFLQGDYRWINRIIDLVYIYLGLIVSYYAFYFLTRIPTINSLFTYTTLTYFYRRYHEPGVHSFDIAFRRDREPVDSSRTIPETPQKNR